MKETSSHAVLPRDSGPAHGTQGASIRASRAEHFFVALFLFLVPFQTRILLGDLVAETAGNEWTRAWLWLSDIAFLILIALWFRHGLRLRDLRPLAFAALFFPALFANPSPAGFWVLLRIVEGLLLFSYARAHRDWLLTSARWPIAFLVGLIAQALIGMAQFAMQDDLGLQVLDESPLDLATPGVAKFSIQSGAVLRAYGLTPHPNILGAMLLSGVAVITFLYLYRGVRWLGAYNLKRQREELVRGTLLFLFLFGIFFTFSRLAWVATLVFFSLVLLAIVFRRSLRLPYLSEAVRYAILSLAIIGMLAFGFGAFLSTRAGVALEEESVTLRQFYGIEAAEMIKDHPYAGVGPGRFVPELVARNADMPDWQAQPVHNVLLLLIAENGIPEMLALLAGFLFAVIATWRRVVSMHDPGVQLISVCLLAYVTSLLLLSSFDHLLWTSQQGRLILWFTLGLLAT